MSNVQIMLAVMGMDQHENGVMAVSRILREAQMRVGYLGRFQTPSSIVEKLRKEPADVIGISCHSWEYLQLVPQLLVKLKEAELDMPVIIGGSVITERDAVELTEKGVAGVFTSGAKDTEIVDAVRDLLPSP